MMEKIDAPAMPFDHQLGLKSGLAAVDAAIDERLAQFKGVPLARILRVNRQIENGEKVSGATASILNEVRESPVAPTLFEIPAGYRLQEPVVTLPSRQKP